MTTAIVALVAALVGVVATLFLKNRNTSAERALVKSAMELAQEKAKKEVEDASNGSLPDAIGRITKR